MHGRIPARTVTLLFMTWCFLGVASETARATDYCGASGDHGIWLAQENWVGYGSQGQLQKVNHGLVGCGGIGNTTGSWNTYGVILSSAGKDWVEVGIDKHLYCVIFCNTEYQVFGEYGVYPGDCCDPIYYDNWTPNGGTVGLKANNVAGTFDWKVWWDSNGGTSMTYLDTYNVCCQYGRAYGEAARSGRTGTDINDHHWDMKFKNSGGTWKPITTLTCWADSDADYQWHHVSDTEFEVEAGGAHC